MVTRFLEELPACLEQCTHTSCLEQCTHIHTYAHRSKCTTAIHTCILYIIVYTHTPFLTYILFILFIMSPILLFSYPILSEHKLQRTCTSPFHFSFLPPPRHVCMWLGCKFRRVHACGGIGSCPASFLITFPSDSLRQSVSVKLRAHGYDWCHSTACSKTPFPLLRLKLQADHHTHQAFPQVWASSWIHAGQTV